MMKTATTILVVEDNELNRKMLAAILEEQYTVLEAENGQEALDILAIHKEHIALIMLDIHMPVMDGYTFLEHVKQDAELAVIPVIVMTQENREEDEVSALAHGATDFVPKPYRPQIILHRAASIINLRKSAAMVNQFRYDKLTGLYSRELFYQMAQEQLQSDVQEAYRIVCVNIENFKLYNDLYGARAGDLLLQGMAQYFRQQLGEDALIGRLRADRFAFLLPRAHNYFKDQSINVSQEIEQIRAVFNITLRGGIYEIVDPTLSVSQMCDRAELASETIKGSYDQYYAYYDDALRTRLLREQAIVDSMEASLEAGEFAIYFQPKFRLKDDAFAGSEALVRWIHPEWGFISPGEFIPLFEKNGFITRMDMFIWEQVCIMLRRWNDRGLPILPVSVNVSRADVYKIDLIDKLMGLVSKYDIDPSWLHLEITESVYVENPTLMLNTISALRHMGFSVEIDDFGSGESSLSLLGQSCVDVLKLDMSFVRNETVKPLDCNIISHIVAMARQMNMEITAEGVETQAQRDWLRKVGCDYAQGYFYAKPMPAGEYEALIKTVQVQAGVHLPEIDPQTQDIQNSLQLSAVSQIYTLVIVCNLTRNFYYVADSDEHMTQTIQKAGVVDQLIEDCEALISEPQDAQRFEELFHRQAQLQAAERGETNLHLRYRQRDDQGEMHWIETRIVFVRGRDNDLYSVIFSRVVDDEVHAEEVLRMAKDIAEQNHHAANEIISRMSHEMRMTLNVIMGILEMDAECEDDIAFMRDNRKKIRISAEYLLCLINDVLDFGQAKGEMVPFIRETFSWRQWCEDITLLMDMRAGEVGLSLQCPLEADDALPEYVMGCALHMERIALNMLESAIAANPDSLDMQLTVRLDAGEDSRLLCILTLEGPGVGSRTDSMELRIAKSLAAQMDSTLQICPPRDDAPGSITATFTLPPAREEDVPPDSEEVTSDIFDKHILLVDDNELNREIARFLLTKKGAKVDTAENGRDAVELFLNSAPGTYDAILMDITMPVMSGYDAARQIRASNHVQAGSIPIIAMTANAFVEDVKKSIQVGMNGHLAKPLNTDMIIRAISQALQQN